MGMYLHEFDRELYEKDIRDEGIALGNHEKAVRTARSLILLNALPMDKIAEVTELSLSEVEEIRKETWTLSEYFLTI